MKRSRSNKRLPDSALKYVLESLIPYSDANIKLAFKPNLFFNDLENISRQKHQSAYKRQSLRNAFYAAKKEGFITAEHKGNVRLTEKGHQHLRPYKPKKLGNSAQLMVVFDIPEEQRSKRRHLRLLLRELKFQMVQQSVWVTRYDCRKFITSEIEAYGLQPYVQVYECARVI
jgi:DNA-binding transcriptional regulator PaaX